VTGFIILFAKSIERPGTEPYTSATWSTSNESRAVQLKYSEPLVSTGVVSSSRLRTGVSGNRPQCISDSVPPMHQPSMLTSSWPLARSVSRTAAGISSQT
jgi:hypothetical protein